MIDVFFRGYGKWYYDLTSGSSVHHDDCWAFTASYDYEASGVFRLNEEDELAYKHTKNLPCVKALLPSNHMDSEFSRMVLHGRLYVQEEKIKVPNEDAEFCYFRISQDKPNTLVIVEPCAEATTQKTDLSNGFDANALNKHDIGLSIDVVTRGDLIDIVSLSKAVAKYRNMTNGEACNWVTTKLNEVEALAFYDISGYTLPERISEKKSKYAACECFNQNWWKNPEKEDLAVPGFNGISAKEIAITKSDAEKYCFIPSSAFDEDRNRPFIAPQEVASNVSLKIITDTIDTEQQNPISKDLAILNEASSMFWLNADPEEKDTHPINEKVSDWLKSQGFSDISARQGAVIIRPEWAAKGRR
jgi:hypothetical protein